MIFGFNTDIAALGTVYHVQTEVREQGPRLESQVFVRGRCIGKRATFLPAGASEDEIQEMARAQHRMVVQAVRGGSVDDVLNHESSNHESANHESSNLETMDQEIAEKLVVEFLGSQRVSAENVILRFRVLSGSSAAARAEVAANWKIDSVSGALEPAFTNDAGEVEMRLALDNGMAELEVKARLVGRETTRRFLVKTAIS